MQEAVFLRRGNIVVMIECTATEKADHPLKIVTSMAYITAFFTFLSEEQSKE